MIIGVGTDIIEIERLKKAIERTPTFVNRVFTEIEQEYCFQKKTYIQSLAGRFSAKEAFVKAMGTGIGKEFNWLDIEVFNSSNGQPQIRILNNKLKDDFVINLSISHEKKYAVAFVIVSR